MPRMLANWRADIVGVEIAFLQRHLTFKTFSFRMLNVSAVEPITNPRNFIFKSGLNKTFLGLL